MAELATVSRHREAQDLGRARHPSPRRRRHVDQRPLARGLLPARDASARSRSRRSRSRTPRAATTCASASTAAASAARPAPSGTASPARSSRPTRSSGCRSSGRASSPVTHDRSSARRPACTRRARRRSSASASRPPGRRCSREQGLARSRRRWTTMPGHGGVVRPKVGPRLRRHFGTDGVRGVVGETLTDDLVERLGRAATLWSGRRSRVLVGRDTRDSGPRLEAALARGIVAAGGTAVLAGVLPTPAVALLSQDLGLVVSASHNPPEYNGVKIFDREGHKLSDADELEIEALLDTRGPGGGSVEEADDAVGGLRRARRRALRLRPRRACGSRSTARTARSRRSRPASSSGSAREVTALANAPDGTNINAGCGATDLGLLQATVRSGDYDLGVAFDGDGDRMLAVDEHGEVVDGDQILAICALSLGVELVAVTTMTNLGLPPPDGRARDPRRHDRRRRPVRPRGAAPRGRHARRRAVGPPDRPRRPRHRRRPRGSADRSAARWTAARSRRRRR